jgi:glycosyltransferase involved in cell wall biosynthesis
VNVLLLTQVLPFPPDSGPKVKTWNLVKWLARRHDVTLASFVRDETARELDALRRYCRAVHAVPMRRGALRDAGFLLASLASGESFLMRRDRRAAMRALVQRLARSTRFDIVHADQLNMAQYAAGVPGARTVLDAHNALWVLYRRLAEQAPPGPRRWLLAREWRRLREYEGRAGRAAAAVLAVSAEDRDALVEAIGAPRDITVLPIAVDADEIQPVRRRPDADRIVHLGTMYWPPNVDAVRWFAEHVYPRVRALRPDVGFDIIGARPPRAIQALAAAGSGIQVAGYVADPSAHLERAAAVVVPVQAGSGMRVKILTALAQALPVVSTSVGCEGIAVEPGVHLLVADEPADFAAATLRLLDDRAAGERLGANGRRLIAERYDYRLIYPSLEGVYARAVEGAAPSAPGRGRWGGIAP